MKPVLDIALIVILALSVLIGYKRGFVKSLMDLVSSLVSFIAARVISYALAPQIFSQYFEESVKQSLSEKVASLGTNASAQVQSALDSIPNISGFLSVAGVDKAEVTQTISQQLQNEGADVVELLMTNLVSPVLTFFLKILIFVIAFAVCILIMKLLSKLLDKLSSLPLLKQANAAFGLLFGALKGVIIIFVVCAAIQLIAGFSGSEWLGELLYQSRIVSAVNAVIGAAKG